MKFGIRPKPLELESLTGYLERIAYMNDIPFYKLMKIAGAAEKDRWLANKLDLALKHSINLSEIAKIVDLPLHIIRSMTMNPIYHLFQNLSPSLSITKMFIIKSRFYCPKCLSEGVNHLLLWQVNDIKICHVHNTYLKNQCDNCHFTQPYINHKKLTRRYCNNCEADLTFQISSEEPSGKFIEEQLKLYNDWRYLRGEKIRYAPALLEDRFSYCSRLLYVIKKEGEVYQHNGVVHSTENEKARLMNFLRQGRSQSGTTLARTLRIIKSQNLSLEEFLNTVVSSEFVQNLSGVLFPEKGEDVKSTDGLGVCLAPWCTSYLRNVSMVRLERLTEYITQNNRIFNDPAICLECSLTYSKDDNLVWREMQNYILKGYEIVLPLVESGYSVSKIVREVGVSLQKINRWIGYFANRGLISKRYIKKFIPKTIEKDIFVKIVHLDKDGSEERFVATRRNYGWTMKDSFYYFADKQVMDYFAFTSTKLLNVVNKSLRKAKVKTALEQLLERDTPITTAATAKLLNVSQCLISTKYLKLIMEYQDKQNSGFRDELYEKAQEYIKQKYCSRGLGKNELYISIGKPKGWVLRNFPEFEKWLEKQEVIRKEKYKNYLKMLHAERAKLIIDEIADKGGNITRKAIANKLKITGKTVSKNSLILELIEQYHSSIKSASNNVSK